LRSERERTYLGFLWWIFEPLMFVGVLWLVFAVVLKTGGPGFISFVAVGLVAWQWFKSSVSHGSGAIYDATFLLRQVPLPPVVMSLVTIATDTVKFLLVAALLVGFFVLRGDALSPGLLFLPLVMLAQLAMIGAVTVWVSALVPFLPDLRVVTETVLAALMFLSGVFFNGADLAEPMRSYFFMNPVAFVLQQWRVILLEGAIPDWVGLLLWTIGSLAIFAAGAYLTERLRRFYPKVVV
jgi:lipopolysaccharide transport system permease protein